jgi:integrase
MRGLPARLLQPADIDLALASLRGQRHELRGRVMILLSVKAGLRACEIAGLRWSMVTDSHGDVASTIDLPARISKYGSGRRIPLHEELCAALSVLRWFDRATSHVVESQRGRAMTAGAVVNRFGSLYRRVGLLGCSSHSGRRTFVTNAARAVHRAGGSLRDVQQLAGHRSIETTQSYIEGDADAQRRLIALL